MERQAETTREGPAFSGEVTRPSSPGQAPRGDARAAATSPRQALRSPASSPRFFVFNRDRGLVRQQQELHQAVLRYFSALFAGGRSRVARAGRSRSPRSPSTPPPQSASRPKEKRGRAGSRCRGRGRRPSLSQRLGVEPGDQAGAEARGVGSEAGPGRGWGRDGGPGSGPAPARADLGGARGSGGRGGAGERKEKGRAGGPKARGGRWLGERWYRHLELLRDGHCWRLPYRFFHWFRPPSRRNRGRFFSFLSFFFLVGPFMSVDHHLW